MGSPPVSRTRKIGAPNIVNRIVPSPACVKSRHRPRRAECVAAGPARAMLRAYPAILAYARRQVTGGNTSLHSRPPDVRHSEINRRVLNLQGLVAFRLSPRNFARFVTATGRSAGGDKLRRSARPQSRGGNRVGFKLDRRHGSSLEARASRLPGVSQRNRIAGIREDEIARADALNGKCNFRFCTASLTVRRQVRQRGSMKYLSTTHLRPTFVDFATELVMNRRMARAGPRHR